MEWTGALERLFVPAIRTGLTELWRPIDCFCDGIPEALEHRVLGQVCGFSTSKQLSQAFGLSQRHLARTLHFDARRLAGKPTCSAYYFFMVVVIIRYETTAAARWALLFIVRTF